MPTKFLKPADGLKVRKPDGSHLAPDGEAVELNSYWLRRLEDGDVVEAEPPAQPDSLTPGPSPARGRGEKTKE